MPDLSRFIAIMLSAAAILSNAPLAFAADPSAAPPSATPPAKPRLSVCADPTNLPYSDQEHPGFENRIAAVLAADMHEDLNIFWQRSYRAFLRRTLLSGKCDVVIGVPTALPGVAVTLPYYGSSYVAITRADDPRHFVSFDDPWLKQAKIGVQMIGADHSETPPQSALAVRNIGAQITGFAMRTSGPEVNPQGRIVDAVADGSIDIAFVWGPIAGYFAKAHDGKLKLDAVTEDPQHPILTFVYPMSVAVRKTDTALRDRLQLALDRHKGEIASILASYGIPVVPVRRTTETPQAAPVAQKVEQTTQTQ